MQTHDRPVAHPSVLETLRQRRQRLAKQIDVPVLLWSGCAPSRNFPANVFPFRANSHFLYFAGCPIEGVVIRLEQGKLDLFMDDPDPRGTLWHGEQPTREAIATELGADRAFPLSDLSAWTTNAVTLPVQDWQTRNQQVQYLSSSSDLSLTGQTRELAQAIVAVRLQHDAGAIAEIRKAASVTVQAHQAGMAASRGATTEAEVRAAMEQVIIAHSMTCAYNSIVTVQGEVLHNEQYHHALQPGDLLLADVGAEAPSGWASDVTRTWPVSGQFSATQRDLYDLVLASHDRCIEMIQPGVEYREVHLKAASVLAEGLVDLGILRGSVEELVEQDAHALFFPHGIGHLLGLDVHDMEDLGDLAGYASGRTRSDRFGLCYLRLDRPLQPGMIVTIEPGFYQVPAILNDPQRRSHYSQMVNWERLAEFADVRGIRIEDDVLVTESGAEVLTASLPTQATQIERLVSGE